MQVNISGHHIEVTPALREYVKEKLNRLEKHVDNITGMDVVLTVEKLRHCAKANITLKGTKLHAESESEDMYAAIDGLADKLHSQAIKYKEKLRSHND